MKWTSLVLTLLTTLLLVNCTATPSPTTMATTQPDNSLTPVTTITPIESPVLTPTLTASVVAITPTLPPVTSLPAETPTITPTHTVPFAPGSVIFTQTPKSNSSEPGPGLEIVDNLFWAVPGSQSDAWTITPLPVGLVWEVHPSPDETTLALRYIDNFQVEQLALYSLLEQQLIPVTGTEKFADLSWWPDSQSVLYAKTANLFLIDTNGFLINALTDNPPPVENEPYAHFTHLEVSPDGLWIATSLMRGVGLADNRFLPTSLELQLFNTDQQHYTTVLDNGGSDFVHLQWSSDSKSLAFTHEFNKGLYIYDLDTFQLLTLGFDPTAFYYSWSPDGYSLVYTQNTTLSVWSREMQTGRDIFTADYIAEPFWSPDGKYMAAGFRVGERAGILLIDADTDEQTEFLLGFSVDWVHWSPDSQWLIYAEGTALRILSIVDGSTYLLLPPDVTMNPPQSLYWLSLTP